MSYTSKLPCVTQCILYCVFTLWIRYIFRCSPDGFGCGNGTCIPLESVCNSVQDCENGLDEESIFCNAQNHCSSTTKAHQCGIGGKCLGASQLCNGVSECRDASDERIGRCKPMNGLSVENAEGIKVRTMKLLPNILACTGISISSSSVIE